MTAKLGDVWDSTTDVLAGRAGAITAIATVAFFLPAVVSAAITAWGGAGAGMAVAGAVVALATLILSIWGALAIIAVASDPDTTRGQAARAAWSRMPAAIAVTLILIGGLIAAMLPIVFALGVSGFDFRAADPNDAMAAVATPGLIAFMLLYSLVLFAVTLWAGARLFLLNPVVLHERRGVGAIGRAFALTRGLTLKLIGIAILLVVVLIVAGSAAQFVTFIVFRLLLGAQNIATATWLGAVASAAVSAAFSATVAVFAARLYAAVTALPRK